MSEQTIEILIARVQALEVTVAKLAADRRETYESMQHTLDATERLLDRMTLMLEDLFRRSAMEPRTKPPSSIM